jgi:hypothetical protein
VKYSFLLVLQLVLIGADLTFNSVSLLFSTISPTALLIVFIFQDAFLVLSIIVMFLMFFNTFAFTSGFICLLIKKFICSLATGGLYLLITLGYQIWLLVSSWEGQWAWSPGLQIAYIIQKLLAVYYYYIYKRGLYRLSDVRLYEDYDWSSHHKRVI